MSREASSSRFIHRNALSRTPQPQDEANENEFENSLNSVHFPPPRTPLNAIPDPSQYHTEIHESDFHSKGKLETVRAARLSGKKFEPVDRAASYVTPRISTRHGKAHSEPNSAQSAPARTGSRASLGGALGAYAVGLGARSTHFAKGKETSSIYRLSRGISVEHSDFSVEVPHFELDEDPSFWADHNVQVLIRIRPLSNMETVAQGYGRCLRQESAQTLVWLGHPETRFTFDHIACDTISQEKLFSVVGIPMVENCMSGYNSCMFAYGQTGSGKTYTMMGEINQLEGNLSEDCGITPRMFEYLFSRIREEEESRKNEKLRFSCKCSFLEIYNEQITDLLEPSSTNLQLREDLRKGVYVENLTEYNVKTVNDVTKLLSQGAANRKMAATNMNSESSRSHSVFTCIIESWWEKDSMNHFRFARLNLVDLAGSERQKSSGAEGDRLKEAANINKSLSTLGLVIMSLVDLAHGKQRHVPYRDSRLTFLLQDSLGGNSKTTIIANVSPSICSSHETLSTLKFAQRAKLIQNNAKVNEDASGDVSTLQRQIQQLKEQLSFIIKHHNLSTSLSSCVPNFEETILASYPEMYNSSKENRAIDGHNLTNYAYEKVKCMEATLVGSLRREKKAETALQKLEAEIEHVNQFAFQREEELKRTKMMLRFREEKIKQLEFLVDGSLPVDHYLMEENKALKEEILLLQARIDKNPDLTRFALENLKLLEQLQLFQNFYEQGERETLLAEISELREQLLDMLERKLKCSSAYENQDNNILEEFDDCRNMNSKLMREVEELRGELQKFSSCTQAAFDTVETVSIESESGDEMASYRLADDADPKSKNNWKMDARFLIESKETEHTHVIKELQLTQEQNLQYKVETESVGSGCLELQNLEKQNKGLAMEGSEDIKNMMLQAKLEKLTKDLEQARLLNCQYQKDQASRLSHQHQVELIHEQVEIETARTILHLQEEVAALQLEFNEKFCCMTQENMRLRNTIETKEEEIRVLCREWERATFELTSFLVEGSKSLEDASGQIETIICSFPQVNVWIREHVERAARACIDKEEAILRLEKSLEDAQKMVIEMELKLNSLKEATMALSGFPQPDNDQSMEEAINLGMLLNEKINVIKMLESKLKCQENHIIESEKRADAAFLVMKWLSDHLKVSSSHDTGRGIHISKLSSPTAVGNHKILETKDDANALTVEDIEAQVELESLVLESENAINSCYMDVEMHISALQTGILQASTTYTKWVKDLVNEIQELKSKFMELKENYTGFQSSTNKFQQSESLMFQKFENQLHVLRPIRDELATMNERLKIIDDSINKKISANGYELKDEYLAEADGWSADNSSSGYSTSGSDFSNESAILGNQLDGFSHTCSSKFHGKITKQMMDLKLPTGSSVQSGSANSKKLFEKLCHDEAMTFCLRKELDTVFDAFNKLYIQLSTILDENDIVNISHPGERNKMVQSFGLMMEIGEASCCNARKVVADDKVSQASIFLGKCEEANATMKEADHVLNALLKANENAKQLNGMWKQASEEMMMERSQLLEENKLLKSSIYLKEEENKLLLDEISHGLVGVAKCVSLFEESFLRVQREVEDRCEVLYSDLLSMGKEILHFVCSSRSSLEDIFSDMMEKELALSIMYHCGVSIHKIPCFNLQSGTHPFGQQEYQLIIDPLHKVRSSGQDDFMISNKKVSEGEEMVTDLEGELGLSCDNMMYENLSLKKELERKEVLLKGLLFDFSLLQEAASKKKDIKDETEKQILALSEVRHELQLKTGQLDNLLVQYKKVEGHLADTENALSISKSDLMHAKERLDILSGQNEELRMILKDLYLKRSEAEEQLAEQKEVVRGLEKEVIHLNSSFEKKLRSSVEDLEEDLLKATNERDQLCEEICFLNDKLEMSRALVDENEAIAVEARQESEASKIYAEQKEEEVKILEHSVEELECTINVLEKKVYEMDEEVERHRLIRESLELELQALRQRLSTVDNFTDIVDADNTNSLQNEDLISRKLNNELELHEAHNQIRFLERNIAEKDEEIMQCKEYISELVLHSEAQASQYQKKYKTLEAMVHEVKTSLSNSTSAAATQDKSEKSSMKARGSSSPFRCISSLVQQMNLEKDQELSVARLRIGELEAVLASRQKEACMLNARLAAAESMTHDVIRDLLGVKLDMNNYANLIDQHQVQKLVEAAHQQTEEFHAMEQEILNLRRQINDLIKEKESCMSEINKKVADILAAQMTVEQLQERDQLLSAQNEMLKIDKTNLLRRVAELDEMVKTLLGTQSTQQQIQQTSKNKENGMLKMGDADLTKRLAHSEKLLDRVNNELAQYRRFSRNHPHDNTYGHGTWN
ncbi:kinesin-like protein KIN-12C isoform X2 [Hevea brasiliensis]|uniref:kinesin-like protein KIN-12C isoform X2 n=1 Tax=Hevea brasiliensis TaxID=3981 RepID=UPI0025F2D2CE|nr:kinesin-like protein KIN-12C isoform X2 [Hevea brasiliensis]